MDNYLLEEWVVTMPNYLWLDTIKDVLDYAIFLVREEADRKIPAKWDGWLLSDGEEKNIKICVTRISKMRGN